MRSRPWLVPRKILKMAIHIKSSATGDKTINVSKTLHYMPCKISLDGEAKVSQYFQPYVDKQDNDEELTASFRGYPLEGKVVKLPKNYRGVVLKDVIQPLSDSLERNVFITHTFDALTYWNWDKIPSRNDAFVRALDWIHISEALHSSIESDANT